MSRNVHHNHRRKRSRRSDLERLGVVFVLFAWLLLVGSGIGIGSFLYHLAQSATAPAIASNQSRADVADVVVKIGEQLDSNTSSQPTHRSSQPINTNSEPLGKADAIESPSVSNLAAPALSKPQEPAFEATGARGSPRPQQSGTNKRLSEPDLKLSEASKAKKPSTVAPPTSVGKAPKAQPCRDDACRQAYAECTRLCDNAMSLSVAACPRVAAGATAQDEKSCLEKRDRSRRYCYSGCALRSKGSTH
jgi:hypothetical protein